MADQQPGIEVVLAGTRARRTDEAPMYPPRAGLVPWTPNLNSLSPQCSSADPVRRFSLRKAFRWAAGASRVRAAWSQMGRYCRIRTGLVHYRPVRSTTLGTRLDSSPLYVHTGLGPWTALYLHRRYRLWMLASDIAQPQP
jgi:hypothetical protein